MAVVAAAADAVVLRARADQVVVLLGLEDARYGREERGPPGARRELHLGREERQAACGAGENPRPLLAVERARARVLGAFLAHDVERLPGKALAPFVLRELHRLRGRGHGGPGRQEALPVFLQFVDAFHIGWRRRVRAAPKRKRACERERFEKGAPIHVSPFRKWSRTPIGRRTEPYLTVYSGKFRRMDTPGVE